MAVGMGMVMGMRVIVAVGAGMGGGRRHSLMLYYNITKVHPSPNGRLPERPPVLQLARPAGKWRRQQKQAQLDAAALLHFNGLSGQAFENSSST